MAIVAASLLAGGCSLLAGTPPDTYSLTAPSFERRARPARGLLVVAEPVAIQALDSQSIVARPGTGEITYISRSQWSDRLPLLLQARIVEAFENANRINAVGRTGERLSPDYQLTTDIRQFEVDAMTGQAVVELAVKIVNDRSGRIVAGEVFSARVPVGGVTGPEAARGLDLALAEVLTDLVRWATARI